MNHDLPPLTHLGTQSRESMTLDAALAEKAALERSRSMPPEPSLLSAGATALLARYLRDDPVRAVLIAAGTGAVLMTIAARLARSGARSVYRKARC